MQPLCSKPELTAFSRIVLHYGAGLFAIQAQRLYVTSMLLEMMGFQNSVLFTVMGPESPSFNLHFA